MATTEASSALLLSRIQKPRSHKAEGDESKWEQRQTEWALWGLGPPSAAPGRGHA